MAKEELIELDGIVDGRLPIAATAATLDNGVVVGCLRFEAACARTTSAFSRATA